MATTNSQPESSISRAHTVVCGNSDSSSSSNLTRTRTVFYSLDTNDTAEDNKKKRSQFETSKDDEDTAEMDDTIELKYKQPKISHDTEQDITEPVTPVTSSPIISSQPLQPQRGQQAESSAVKTTKESDIPDWHNNYTAWAYLQSQNPEYESRYLVKRDNMEEGRSGYVLGRKSDCDIVLSRSEISKIHCIIHMETGAVGEKKGIRIYLDDRSFNGTYINGVRVGRNDRKMLRHGDEIQLFKKSAYSDSDPRLKFFKVLLPPCYEAERCERLYSLTKVLGKGNFASVFLAKEKSSGREVAIKVLSKTRLVKPKQQKSVQTEIGVMMSLQKHPFIVNLYRVFNEEHKIYLVLEYLPGGELFQHVVENQRLSEDDTRFIFWQLFKGVEYLHCCNIVHRDLKPENVLIVNKNTLQIKISDFGLANIEQRDQTFGSQCGTPNYVAPEILDSVENRAYNKQCDLWSLGVMLYICLCGFPPFSEESAPPSMKMQIKQGLFSFPSPYWDDISQEAKDLIKALLKVNPNERLTAVEAYDHPWMQMNNDALYKRIYRIDHNITQTLEGLLVSTQSPTAKTENTLSPLKEY